MRASSEPNALLAPDEPAAVETLCADGTSDIVLCCEHAAARLPRALGTLGLSDTALGSHIAWDIGAGAVARLLSQRLDAPLVLHNYSRLVIDCNRPLAAGDSIPESAEWGSIAGNAGLTAAQRTTRADTLFKPFHQALQAVLDARGQQRRRTLLIAIHSFTPNYRGQDRPWDIGLMYGADARLAVPVLAALRRDPRLQVGDNQPYAMEEGIDYTLPEHGQRRGIPHLGVEIRQDQVADPPAQARWAGRLASLLRQVAITPDIH